MGQCILLSKIKAKELKRFKKIINSLCQVYNITEEEFFTALKEYKNIKDENIKLKTEIKNIKDEVEEISKTLKNYFDNAFSKENDFSNVMEVNYDVHNS